MTSLPHNTIVKSFADYTMDDVRQNISDQRANARTANLGYIAAGVIVILKHDTPRAAKKELRSWFDTEVTHDTDMRNAAMRLTTHHAIDLLSIIEGEASLRAANNALIDYIAQFTADSGALYTTVNGKRRCLPKLPLVDLAKENADKEAYEASLKAQELEDAVQSMQSKKKGEYSRASMQQVTPNDTYQAIGDGDAKITEIARITAQLTLYALP